MSGDEFKQILKKQLDILPLTRQIEFAIHICKRLYPEYEYFQEKYQWGNASSLAKGIEYVESHQHINKLDISELKTLIAAINEATPDMDDYGDWCSSYALNAAIVVSEALDFLADHNHNIVHLLEISRYMTDTIDFKIYEADENKNIQDHWQHPRMQQEINWQIEATK